MTESIPVPSRLAALFKARREELDLTQEDIASRVTTLLGPEKRLTQQVYAAFEKGRSQSTRYAPAIARALDLPIEILDEEWTPSPNDQAKKADLTTAKFIDEPIVLWGDEPPLGDEVEVPMLKEIALSNNSGQMSVVEQGKVKLGFSKSTLLSMGIDVANIVCITVSGNSMEPVIPDGGRAGVDRGRTEVRDGDLFAINHDGQLRVKALYRLPRGGLRMRSFNRDEHPDEEYSAEDIRQENIEIIGRIFWYSVLR